MRRTTLLLVLPLLGACGGADAPAPQTSASAARPSAEAALPTAAAPSTPAAPSAPGDVDGDGRRDEIAYSGSTAVVTLSSGREVRSTTESDFAGEPGELSTAGVVDVDGDGRGEVFVQIGRGASTAFLLPLRYDGTTLAPLKADGRALLLGIGGSTTHGDGFSCTDDGTLVVRSASSDDGTAFTVTETTYRIEGHRLVRTGGTTVADGGLDDPRVQAAFAVDCRSVLENP